MGTWVARRMDGRWWLIKKRTRRSLAVLERSPMSFPSRKEADANADAWNEIEEESG